MSIRDKLLETAHVMSDYRDKDARDNRSLGSYLTGKDMRLPAPYKRVGGPLEKVIQKEIKQALDKAKLTHWRIEMSGKLVSTGANESTMIPSENPGISDIIGILPDGRFFAIEIKRPGGKLSSHQVRFLSDIKDNNGVACVGVSTAIVDVLLDLENAEYPDNFPFLIA